MKSTVSPYRYWNGFREGIPIGLGYLSVSFGFGISTVGQGLRAAEAVLISMTNLTSAGQVAGVAVIAAGGTVIEMILTQLVINLRYALMGISMTQRLDARAKPWRMRMLLCWTLTDEIYAAAVTKPDVIGPSYLWGLMTRTLYRVDDRHSARRGGRLGFAAPAGIGAGHHDLRHVSGNHRSAMRRERGVLCTVALGAGFRCAMTCIPALSRISDGFAIILWCRSGGADHCGVLPGSGRGGEP